MRTWLASFSAEIEVPEVGLIGHHDDDPITSDDRESPEDYVKRVLENAGIKLTTPVIVLETTQQEEGESNEVSDQS